MSEKIQLESGYEIQTEHENEQTRWAELEAKKIKVSELIQKIAVLLKDKLTLTKEEKELYKTYESALRRELKATKEQFDEWDDQVMWEAKCLDGDFNRITDNYPNP